MVINELPPNVDKESNLLNNAAPVEFVEAGIAIRVHPASVIRQVHRWVFAFAVRGELA